MAEEFSLDMIPPEYTLRGGLRTHKEARQLDKLMKKKKQVFQRELEHHQVMADIAEFEHDWGLRFDFYRDRERPEKYLGRVVGDDEEYVKMGLRAYQPPKRSEDEFFYDYSQSSTRHGVTNRVDGATASSQMLGTQGGILKKEGDTETSLQGVEVKTTRKRPQSATLRTKTAHGQVQTKKLGRPSSAMTRIEPVFYRDVTMLQPRTVSHTQDYSLALTKDKTFAEIEMKNREARQLEKDVRSRLETARVGDLLESRQVRKTTLLQKREQKRYKFKNELTEREWNERKMKYSHAVSHVPPMVEVPIAAKTTTMPGANSAMEDSMVGNVANDHFRRSRHMTATTMATESLRYSSKNHENSSTMGGLASTKSQAASARLRKPNSPSPYNTSEIQDMMKELDAFDAKITAARAKA